MAEVSVVTVARTAGAHGEEIARGIAAELGFRYIDSEIITRAAEAVGWRPEDVAKAEGRQSLIQKIMLGLASASYGADGGVTMPVLTPDPGIEHVIVDTVKAIAAEGKAVIVAHGASVALAERDDVLRVFVTASPGVRAERAGGEKVVRDSDKARAAFFSRFFGLHEEPLYDVVLNTDSVSIESAIRAVSGLARS